MKTESKIFGKEHLRGISDDLQNEIIQRYNDYDTLIRVMKNVSTNIKTITLTTTGWNDNQDLREFAKLLNKATDTKWLKENCLYY